MNKAGIPSWLLKENAAESVSHWIPSRHKTVGAFLDKTLRSISRFMAESFLSEKYASHDGLIQKIHPTVKMIIFFVLIVAVSLSRSPYTLLSFAFLIWAVAALTGINSSIFLRRVLVVPLIFTFVIAVPATVNLVTPGKEVFVLMKEPIRLSFTSQGFASASLLVSRVLASISLATLLVLTTKWNDLLSSLKFFRIPGVFVFVLEMSYRYIFLLIRIVEDMHLAMKSRLICGRRPGRGRGLVASRIGFLFKKSLFLAEQIHLAMISRGYEGQVKALSRDKPLVMDYLWLAVALVLTIGVISI